jgi:hypothetical protein
MLQRRQWLLHQLLTLWLPCWQQQQQRRHLLWLLCQTSRWRCLQQRWLQQQVHLQQLRQWMW